MPTFNRYNNPHVQQYVQYHIFPPEEILTYIHFTSSEYVVTAILKNWIKCGMESIHILLLIISFVVWYLA